jgi:hypothetical protein
MTPRTRPKKARMSPLATIPSFTGPVAYSRRFFDIELEFVDIAPGPVFAWFDRTHNRVLRLMEVLGRVSVLGAVAAPHVSAV